MSPLVRIGLTASLLLATLEVGVAADRANTAAPPSEGVAASTPIGSGPHPAIMEVDPGLPTHTLYHPADLAAGGRLPVVVWGNGACWNAGNSFRWFLSDIASYGYMVIAVGPIVDPPIQRAPVPMAPVPAGSLPAAALTKLPPSATHSSQ